MTREELDFIGSMNMCDEISDDAYKEIVCHCEEQEPCEDVISRQAAQAKIKSICDEYRLSYEDGERKAATGGSAYALGHAFDDLPTVKPQEPTEWEIDQLLKARDKAVEVTLDKIKAEIRKGKYAEKKGLPERSLIYANGWDDGLELAIDIIDKYRCNKEEVSE